MFGSLRLFCALLTLLLALPAMQARACSHISGPDVANHHAGMTQAQGAASHRHEAPPAPAPAEMRHDCIGCIAPIDIGSYRPVERLRLLIDRSTTRPDPAALAGRPSPPEPPPPRILA
jgi:hypothetical protein